MSLDTLAVIYLHGTTDDKISAILDKLFKRNRIGDWTTLTLYITLTYDPNYYKMGEYLHKTNERAYLESIKYINVWEYDITIFIEAGVEISVYKVVPILSDWLAQYISELENCKAALFYNEDYFFRLYENGILKITNYDEVHDYFSICDWIPREYCSYIDNHNS